MAANAFFVAAEFALVAVDRGRVEQRAAEGAKQARTTEVVLRRLSYHLSGAQLGITVTSLVLGFVAEPTIATVLDPIISPVVGEGSSRGVSIALALALATVFQMVVGELIPKNVAIARPLGSALRLARPMELYSLVFGPVIRFLNGAANWTVRRLGIEPSEELASVRTLEELELLIRFSGEGGTLDAEAMELLTRSIRFGEKTAADALVPRVAVTSVGRDDTVADLVAVAVQSGFSRFPVCGTDLDDVLGVVHVKDVYGLAPAERATAPVASIMSDAFAVPETRELDSLLIDLRGVASHLAVVVDEYGGTAGIVTLEDILEEIVGEIDDEYDAPLTPVAVQRPGEFVLPASLHADEVRDAAGFEVPDGEYETLAGFVIDRLGRIPVVGDEIVHDGWRLNVAEMDRLRVATVKLWAPPPASAP
ncbi:hemolysin family protein [soil metagenome]